MWVSATVGSMTRAYKVCDTMCFLHKQLQVLPCLLQQTRWCHLACCECFCCSRGVADTKHADSRSTCMCVLRLLFTPKLRSVLQQHDCCFLYSPQKVALPASLDLHSIAKSFILIFTFIFIFTLTFMFILHRNHLLTLLSA